MKRILVLTDFSANAEHAAENAMYLSKQLNTGLLLYHAYEMVPIDPYYTGGPYVPDPTSVYAVQGEKELKLLTETLTERAEKIEPGTNLPIQHLTGEGHLGENVKDIIAEKDISLVVMGASSGSAFDHLIGGQETLKVINKATLPVLIIPANTELKNIRQLVFATNFEKNDINAIAYLADLAQTLGFKIDIVHIDAFNSGRSDLMSEITFKRFVNGLNFTGITYHDIRGKDVVNRLNSFCKTSGADVLAMVHYHQNFFAQLFGTCDTKKELAHQQQALLVFPPDFVDA